MSDLERKILTLSISFWTLVFCPVNARYIGDSGKINGAIMVNNAKGNVEKNIKYLHPKTGIINQAIKAKNKAPIAHQKDKVITALPLTEVGIYSEYNVAT